MDQNITGGRGGARTLASAGLAKGAAAGTFKTANAVPFTVDGVMYSLSATDNLAFSSGHTALANQQITVFAVWVDSANAVSTTQGSVENVADLTNSKRAVALPDVVDNKALVGLLHVKTTSGAFTPGTTNLDAAGTTTYYNCMVMPTKPFTS